jgi:hypothetical protein
MELPLLRSLVLQGISIDIALSTLAFISAPNLLSLELSGAFSSLAPHQTAIDCALPKGRFAHLKSLKLSYFPFCLILKLVYLLECPYITHLGLAVVDKACCEEHRPGDDVVNQTKLSVTSFALRSIDPLEIHLGYEKLMATARRFISSVQMPDLSELLLTAAMSTVSQYLTLANLFGDVRTKTMLFKGQSDYGLTLVGRGQSHIREV